MNSKLGTHHPMASGALRKRQAHRNYRRKVEYRNKVTLTML